jgi:hypothetical protein
MKTKLGAFAASIGVISLTLFVLAVSLAYGRLVPGVSAFGIVAGGMLTGVLAIVLAAIVAVRSGMSSLVGLALLGVIPAACLAYGIVTARGAPVINDVTTDRVYPPAFTHAKTLPANAGRDMNFTESFKPQVEKA